MSVALEDLVEHPVRRVDAGKKPPVLVGPFLVELEPNAAVLELAFCEGRGLWAEWLWFSITGCSRPPVREGKNATIRASSLNRARIASDFREIGAREGASVALHTRATMACAEGDNNRAEELFEEGLRLSAEVGDETSGAYFSEGRQRSPPRRASWCARRDCGEPPRHSRKPSRLRLILIAPDRSLHQQHVASARSGLEGNIWEGGGAGDDDGAGGGLRTRGGYSPSHNAVVTVDQAASAQREGAEVLVEGIGRALVAVTPEDAASWFAHAGYWPQDQRLWVPLYGEAFRSSLATIGKEGTQAQALKDSPAVGKIRVKYGTRVIPTPADQGIFFGKALVGFVEAESGRHLDHGPGRADLLGAGDYPDCKEPHRGTGQAGRSDPAGVLSQWPPDTARSR